MQFIGRNGSKLLFSVEDKAVVVDELNKTVITVDQAEPLIASFAIEDSQDIPESSVPYELAIAAATNLDIKVFSNNDRLYTIPKSVVAEAKRGLAWRKEEKRGGTSVGLNTARTLARGGQIGIRKIRHIAKYFPRHEVDKKGTGYSPGEKNYPSNGRIAWALWGGDSARSWATAIVNRENRKAQSNSITASYKFIMDEYENPEKIAIQSFIDGDTLSESLAPTFFIRIRLDGTGIDRLYKTETDGSVFVWDDGMWEDLGNINHDFETYDRSLDDPYDTFQKIHVPIDAESAAAVAGFLDSNPDKTISVEKINSTESKLFLDEMDEVDWDSVDDVSYDYSEEYPKYAEWMDFSEDSVVAAGEGGLKSTTPSGTNQDGNYTPEERSKLASSQVRDKTGKFAKSGGKVVVGGNPQYTGTIKSINPESQTVRVEFENGNSVDVPAISTESLDTFKPIPMNRTRTPRNLTQGILGEPRVPIDSPFATLPDRLPQLGNNKLQVLNEDYGAWTQDVRSSNLKQSTTTTPPATPTPTPTPTTPKASDPSEDAFTKAMNEVLSYKSKNAYNDPLLRDFLQKTVKRPDGTTYQPNARFFVPKSGVQVEDYRKKADKTSWNESKDPSWMNKPPVANWAPPVRSSGLVAAGAVELTPETSDVSPIYMAIVSPDDPQAVMDLVSLIPATSDTSEPMTFKRKPGQWEKDETLLNDIKSPTPPPIVVLDDDTLAMVMSQIDSSAKTASAYPFESAVLSLMAAGGVDRNRGNAEELRRYWLRGRGAAKIRWNTPGDWTRCVRQLSKYMGPRAKGYCALRHKEATGMWTGDKEHRQKYGKRGIKGDAFSTDFIIPSNAVISQSITKAKIQDAKHRVYGLTADASEENILGAEFVIPLVIPEGKESGDGRKFNEGSISMRELPLPLLWQIETGEGHSGSVVIGKITFMERTDEGIGNARGRFDTGEYGKEAERLVKGGFIKGVSADMDMFEANEEQQNASEKDSDTKVGGGKMNITKARVMAVTLVPKPAFQECKIEIADQAAENEEKQVIQDGVYVDGVNPLDASALVACGIVAGAIPVTPPKQWFENQKLTKPTALTVTDEGQVFGHIAAWHVDHIGMAFGTRPPRSKSGYSYFHTGVVRTEEGSDVPVGQLTLAGGHASLEASASEAVRHYDDTASAIADVHAGEDAYGIWVSGALRPGTTPEQIRAVRASAPSGDWRPIKGALELVAVCQVNVPGFPIARARVASGQVMALVAAGANVLAQLKYDPLRELNERVDKLEAPIISATASAKSRIQAVTAAIKADELSARIRKMRDEDTLYMLQMFDDTDAELSVISRKVRMRLAEEGKALKDGSFPIRNIGDLKNAVQAYGRSKPGKRGMVRRHIMKMARKLERDDLIPDTWTQAGKTTSNLENFSTNEFVDKLDASDSITQEEYDSLKKAPKSEQEDNRTKYVPGKTQPRDASGKFRQVLARLKTDLGVSGSDSVIDKIEEAENLDNAGNYAGAAKAAGDLLGMIDRLDTGALNSESLENIRVSAGELGKVIANLPFAFGESAQKIRFSDIPPALKDLLKDMIKRVEDKIGPEDAEIATKGLKSFMSGSDLYNQSEISSEMSKLLRLLT